jgi:hypothetical protein
MITLSNSWLTDPLFDLEYKQYMVLGYLQQAEQSLGNNLLFPYAHHLQKHSAYLDVTYQGLESSFPHAVHENDLPEALSLVHEMISFSKPRFQEMIWQYKNLETAVQQACSIELLGLHPLFDDAGFLLIPNNLGFLAYGYWQTGLLPAQGYSPLRFEAVTFIESREPVIARNYLYDYLRTSGNPSVFVLHSAHQWPIEETLLPIGGKMIYEYLKR